jgi:pyruvate/2-oxoglutarate dehydrogenase complex dihydrolipoamide acyltransferase (E2) component
MPALSPTMTEGNIASWKIKEGDSFSAGDVLLEIETDKASMDVEAQDDGIMAKIIQGDGAKGVQVGARIGVLAEPGDDLGTLDIPAEESSTKSLLKKDSKPEPEAAPAAEAPKSSSAESSESAVKKPSGPPKKQTYPLLPSVEHLIHEKGLDSSAIDKMIPSGPNNRLLKGDVLAYLGSISSSYPSELSTKIEKLTHLDLSNIRLALPASATKIEATAAVNSEVVVEDLEIAIPISMKAVIEIQRRIQSTLGVDLPLSTFIARATDVANDNLPRSKTYTPNSDELFNLVIGLDKITSISGFRGSFLPQITALPSSSPTSRPSRSSSKSMDIIDVLSGRTRPSKNLVPKPQPGISASVSVFSVKVPKGDEKRAQVFLDRVKTVLEGEPGRLVL